MEKEEKKFEKIRCLHCDSAFVYFKVKEGVWQCRKCGKTFKPEIKEE